ncbi:MAG: c-type cytochrome [Pseudomonadota bacterium]
MLVTKRILSIVGLSLACFTFPAHSGGDPEAGKAKAVACADCHGADGNSKNPAWPSLAGQMPAYISTQLRAFRAKTRKSPMMSGLAKGLSDEDIDDLAAYFAALPAKSVASDADQAAIGKTKYASCVGCHGVKGEGLGAQPRLAGQQPAYIVRQLKNFKSGARATAVMKAKANALSEADMLAIAAYLAALE